MLETFAKDYQAKYGRSPATFAGNAYDATMMLAAAIEKAGPDRAKLRDAVEGTKDHRGVTAVYSYAPDDHSAPGPTARDRSAATGGTPPRTGSICAALRR